MRKNLKSGGSSKKLNRTTSRTSMAKQRWMNRNNETGNNGGGKYGKYNKFKKGGYSGGNDNDDSNTGSLSNNNSYNKPRGLQQWGLDALEMSLNLIEQQQLTAEQNSSGDNITTTENATNTSGVMDKNNTNVGSAEKKGGIVLEDSEGEEEGDGCDYESEPNGNTMRVKDSSAVAMEIDPPVQSYTVSRSGNNSSHAIANRSESTTATVSSQRITSNTATAAKAQPTTTAISTAYPTYPTSSTSTTSLLSSIHTNRAKLSKQSAKLHKAELKQAQRILENERVTNMTLCAPKCPGHSMPSKLLVVKKSGANKV